ncbi:MAG: DNA/RNA nuclease SfsA [Gemmatimonadetes bacterium]|nr:DNA/RNA nuclease SfsA [Gemmatimonadota bacterium]
MDTKTYFPPICSLPLVEGTFLSRPNRFAVHCGIEGRETKVFMPNPGRMGELLLPGVVLILADHGEQALRKTRYTVMAVRYQGRVVFLHTHLNNTVAHRLIESRAIPALKEYGIAGTEVTVGGNRFDFLLKDAEGALCLEVKSCTLSANGIAMFPDAVTERGRRHLESLAGMCSAGERGALLFLIHHGHGSAGLFLPDYHTDYAFSLAFRDVENKLPVRAVSIEWTEDLRYRIACPEVAIPWDAIRRECVDRGHLLIVERDGAGYRVSLTRYEHDLSKKAGRCAERVYPVRTSIDMAEDMAGVLSHLYGNPRDEAHGWTFRCGFDPVPTPGFQQALLDFRMPRRLARESD